MLGEYILPLTEASRGMAAPNVKVGQRVEVVGKEGLYGSVAYVGTAQFAPGKWIGKIGFVKIGNNISFRQA